MIDLLLSDVEEEGFFQKFMDIDFDGLGQIRTVSGVFLLNQRVSKNIHTAFKQDDTLHPNRGTLFPLLLGEKIDTGLTRAVMVQEAERSIGYLKLLQASEPRFTPAERALDLDEVIIERISDSRAKFQVTLLISTESGGEAIPVQVVV